MSSGVETRFQLSPFPFQGPFPIFSYYQTPLHNLHKATDRPFSSKSRTLTKKKKSHATSLCAFGHKALFTSFGERRSHSGCSFAEVRNYFFVRTRPSAELLIAWYIMTDGYPFLSPYLCFLISSI